VIPSVLLRIGLIAALAASSSLGFACAAHPAQPSVPLGSLFELRYGTSATLQGLKLTFDGVKSDSRCPQDAVCVWAGEAVVTLTMSRSGGARVQQELRTTPVMSEASYLAYRVKLVALAPYPRSAQQIRSEDYVATLAVDTP
jgi:hypothetical protein